MTISAFDKVARGAKYITLQYHRIDARLAGLPWGAPVRVKSHGKSLLVAAGPAQYRNGWALPLLQDDNGNVLRDLSLSQLRRLTTRLRRKRFLAGD